MEEVKVHQGRQCNKEAKEAEEEEEEKKNKEEEEEEEKDVTNVSEKQAASIFRTYGEGRFLQKITS